MKIVFNKTLGGAKSVLKSIKDDKTQMKVAALFQGLAINFEGMLESADTKKLKGYSRKVVQITINDYRIFYTIESDCMHILHVIQKKKNHTEKRYEQTIKMRLKNI